MVLVVLSKSTDVELQREQVCDRKCTEVINVVSKLAMFSTK